MAPKTAIIILDGWGIGDGSKSDAIAQANTPFMDHLMRTYPHTTLKTYGEYVGLPQGQMGNSEVGHLNIGAGRVVYQDLLRINRSIDSGEFFKNSVLLKAMQHAKENGVALHVMGLVSDGGVHSHTKHLFALLDLAKQMGLKRVFIHAFTDGRDTDPNSGIYSLKAVEQHIQGSTTQLVSVVGRYYGMDRDLRWERTKNAYELLVRGIGKPSKDLVEGVQHSYDAGISDEFIEPLVAVDVQGIPLGRIQNQDVVICFNYRTDRCRQITRVLTQESIANMQPLELHYVTLTRYDARFKNVAVVFEKDNLENTMGEVLAAQHKTQLRAAETEKYPHVSFFFSGGREALFEGEHRILAPSPKVATYDLQPQMSAQALTDQVISYIQDSAPDFICLNYANPDMVGHTGVYEAIVKAVETVDGCLKQVVEVALTLDYHIMVIADHGNADFALNPDGSPNTAHSMNPVPCILVSKVRHHFKKEGILADVAPTLLKIMGIEPPKEMTGTVLIS